MSLSNPAHPDVRKLVATVLHHFEYDSLFRRRLSYL
jgi:hypothetical protein